MIPFCPVLFQNRLAARSYIKWVPLCFVITLSVLGPGPLIIAQVGQEELQKRFEEKCRKLTVPHIALEDHYETQLKQLEKEALAKGALDHVVGVQAEIKAFRNPNYGKTEAYESYPKLGDSRAIYQRRLWELKDASRTREVELRTAYLARLVQLRDELTRAGHVEAALALEAESAVVKAALSKLEAMERWKGKGNFERTVLWELRDPSDLVKNGSVLLEEDKGVYKLSSDEDDMTRFESMARFRPPIRLIARAATNSTSVRLYYGAGLLVIFNWESRPDELRLNDPTTGLSHLGYKEKGKIEINRYYDFEARITENRISIYVDGELRASRQGNFSNANGPVGIGPAFGGVVSVEAMAVFAEK